MLLCIIQESYSLSNINDIKQTFNETYAIYNNSELTFSIKYPLFWEVSEFDNISLVSFCPPHNKNEPCNFSFKIQLYPNLDRTLDEWAIGDMTYFKNFQIYDTYQLSKSIINGYQSYTLLTSKDNMKYLFIYFYHNDVIYIISFEAEIDVFNNYLPLIYQMVNSIRMEKFEYN